MAGAGGVLAWSCLVRRLQLRCQDNRARHPRPPGKPHSAPRAAKPFVDHGASILSQVQTVPNLHVNMLGSAGTSDRSFGRVTSRIAAHQQLNVTIAQKPTQTDIDRIRA
jgi:hypothetical protein